MLPQWRRCWAHPGSRFSSNASLLEAFQKIVGGSQGHHGSRPVAEPSTKIEQLTFSAEQARQFNPDIMTQNSKSADYQRFSIPATYTPSDLIKSETSDRMKIATIMEERKYEDIFRRHKYPLQNMHKNVTVLSSMISQVGKILPRKATGMSAKTQRHLSKAIRRARQMDKGVMGDCEKLYEKPSWASPPATKYALETIKNGVVLESIEVPFDDDSFVTFGRLPTCSLPLDHQSISRFHAVIQFGTRTAYLYDLNSSHGTFLNKEKIKSLVYVAIPPNSVIRFGESSRFYALIQPKCDESRAEKEENRFSLADLNKFADQENYKLKIESNTEGELNFVSFELEIEGDVWREESCGDTKDAALQAAVDKLVVRLESEGLLPQTCKRFSAQHLDDGDDDDFYDRTKTKKVPKLGRAIETFESLNLRHAELQLRLVSLEAKISSCNNLDGALKEDEEDELDTFVLGLASKERNKERAEAEKELAKVRKDLARVEDLLEIARPVGI